MKIGIDCRMYGLEHAGIGRYVQNLVEELLKMDHQNEYVLFVRKDFIGKIYSNIQSPISNIKFIIAEARHYSLKEQFLMPYLIGREKVDLMHFPHFNVPVFYLGKYVVTIHDLIKHESRGPQTTTKTPFFYLLKYLGYQIVFWLAVKRAVKIFVPSKTVALQLEKVYGIDKNKVKVTYEGVDNQLNLKSQISNFKNEVILEKYNVKKPFLLYVGSVYPHKNIPNLIKAVIILNNSLNNSLISNIQYPVSLVVSCARSVFWERLKKQVKDLNAGKYIQPVGFVPDDDLTVLYKEATAFVFPSLSEGFGLPGLEAMAIGLPVLASNIPVFKEVYGEAALYFNPKDPQDIALIIRKLVKDKNLQLSLKEKGLENVLKYSWEKMAKETLDGYQKV